MDQHKPLYNTITDYCPHGVWLCSDNPRASALYRLLLSAPLYSRPRPVPSLPEATPSPAPEPAAAATPAPAPTTAQAPHCTLLDLEKWLEQQIGGRLSTCLQWAERYR
jgi:hypothetical protein